MTTRPEILPARRPGVLHAGLIVGWISIASAFAGLIGLRETFRDKLDDVES